MNNLSFEPLIVENVVLTPRYENEQLNIVFRGMIDMRDPSQTIQPYLLKIHEDIQNNNIQNINVDFMDLSFMNSSGIKVLITWLMKIKYLPLDRQYKITVLYNPNISWQESCLHVIKTLLGDYIILQEQ